MPEQEALSKQTQSRAQRARIAQLLEFVSIRPCWKALGVGIYSSKAPAKCLTDCNLETKPKANNFLLKTKGKS